MTDPKLIAAMSKPDFYPHKPKSVELVQTHISYVFIADNIVYKVKKPMNFGFLDFTTLEKRKYYCEEELRLNRRLAPGVYLEVATIYSGGKSGFSLNSGTAVADYAVVMKKLPQDKMLKTLLARGEVRENIMDKVAAKIASFHAGAETGGRINEMGGIKTIRHNHEENFAQTQKYITTVIPDYQYSFIRDYVTSFLKANETLLEKRVAQGKIRDGHGDLHLEHICVDEDIIIFDCIEFNERFRFADVAAEVAFLTMDLDFNGYASYAEAFTDFYLKYSGDTDMLKLLDFYRCYYAYVRGKVISLRLDQKDTSDAERQVVAASAARYFELSYHYAARLDKPVLILTAGLMGSGKSYQARTLAKILGAQVIRTDLLRKEMLNIDPTQPRRENFGQGIYSEESSRLTYDKVYDIAKAQLRRGKSVIIDASFKRREERKKAYALARELGIPFYLIECVCPDGITKKRLDKRAGENDNISDGRWEIFHRQKEDFDAIDELPAHIHFKIDTSDQPEIERQKIVRILKLGEG